LSYVKRILHVDLSTGKTEIEPLKEEMAKKYIGGIGLRNTLEESALECAYF